MQITSKKLREHDLLLIDDDPDFCALFSAYGRCHGINIDWYTNLDELHQIGECWGYGAAIIDYDLTSITGPQITEYFPSLLMETPVVLISATRRTPPSEQWPEQVKIFIGKYEGIEKILSTALAVAREKIVTEIVGLVSKHQLREVPVRLASLDHLYGRNFPLEAK